MAITEQLAEFAEFAKRLEAERGEEVSLDEAMREWQAIDHAELAILRERYASYQAGERGRPVDEMMAELRTKHVAKYGR